MIRKIKEHDVDGKSIWKAAYSDGLKKYRAGHNEHKSKFWTAGLMWYAKNLRAELLDGVSYAHHINSRLLAMLEVANLLERKKISTKEGVALIRDLVNATPISENETN
jgi:hypothetical protein